MQAAVMDTSAKIGEGTLPQDHEDQLQLGVRIVQSAFQNKVHSLEQEIRGLRLTSEEQRNSVAALQKKSSALEVELVESHQRAQQLAEENKELFKTVASLRKQIGRLEGLKAAVLSSIQDDAEKEAEIGDTRALLSEEYLKGATPLTAMEMGIGGVRTAPGAAGGLRALGFEALAQGTAAAGAAPAGPGGAAQGGGGPAALGTTSPVIDGKAFFRQARSRLSYEAFNQFLASIKRLNNQQQTREETLEEARRIFGTEQQDLYKDFESLLNRQGL